MITKPGKQERNKNCQTGEEKNDLGGTFMGRGIMKFSEMAVMLVSNF
jgi:hypothetical protein